ncbi:MAG TPA: GTPase HflX [Thermoanaerobacterales bacterium]|nr:GTPase HflX [Thermoanaerobacterales bacterium]
MTFDQDENTLEELEFLAQTAGVQVAEKVVQKRQTVDVAFYIGKGKAYEIADIAKAHQANAVIFDDELSPVQIRNLENVIGAQIIDRTTLILDIFAQRAMSQEGQIQVELAQLKYMLPRLTGKGIELSREGGGIGTRGPGETKLETDRRHIRRRISRLKTELEKVRKNRKVLRESREFPVVSLVGYTNAGKSTLMNALTDAKVSNYNRLFDTLDTTVRGMVLPDERTILLSDTVGFIRKLPHDIIEAFKATLEEVTESDLIIHVADASSPNLDIEISTVKSVLKQIGADNKPTILAVNKIDKIPQGELLFRGPDVVPISAQYGINLASLVSKISEMLPSNRVGVSLLIPYEMSHLIDLIYETSLVEKSEFKPEGIQIEGMIDNITLEKIRKDVQIYPI